jgi:hypothetical protein
MEAKQLNVGIGDTFALVVARDICRGSTGNDCGYWSM